ncbi:hypothetical protein NHX12_003802 [Muraenolepis orangiensis]|uniref:SH2 domain-containing protein n=1 Tax=Muraenolepis orangiensis TaxID=630683 RepID=A0A9Q0DTA8_9TELE|nr:hypothetical protein NHX12_003802 [Muraenolepis orangiensis]
MGTSRTGFFPSGWVRPCPCVPKPVDYSAQPWYAGPMERSQAEVELLPCENSSFLVRHRSREETEYAISIKFNDEVKHIKILTREGCFYIAESRLFKSLLDLVEYYKDNSLREGFRSLDTTLQEPYRGLADGNIPLPQASTAVCLGMEILTTPESQAPRRHCRNRKWSGTGSGQEQEVVRNKKWSGTGSGQEQEVVRNRKWSGTGSGQEQEVVRNRKCSGTGSGQ